MAIEKRVLYGYEGTVLRIIISGRTEKFKESLLAAWLFAWLLSIGYFIFRFGTVVNRDEKLFILVLLVFMLYFFIRLGKVWLWRKYGKEMISITEDKLILKRDRRGYGKAQEYLLSNIKGLGLIIISQSSFISEMEKSYWVIGNERVGFTYFGKRIKFGLKLTDEETSQLVHLIKIDIKKKMRGDSFIQS